MRSKHRDDDRQRHVRRRIARIFSQQISQKENIKSKMKL